MSDEDYLIKFKPIQEIAEYSPIPCANAKLLAYDDDGNESEVNDGDIMVCGKDAFCMVPHEKKQPPLAPLC